jgi:hypothetical protein
VSKRHSKPDPDWLTATETMALIGCSYTELRRLSVRGVIGYRTGSAWGWRRYSKADIHRIVGRPPSTGSLGDE